MGPSGRLAVALALLLLCNSGAATEIVSWAGNTREWNQRLGVTLVRMGCSSSPSECLRRIETLAVSEGVDRWTISVKGPGRLVDQFAAEYSRLSLTNRRLVGIDIDDFVSTLRTWKTENQGVPAELLVGIARSAKSANDAMQFGVTVYEDQLSSPALLSLPLEARSIVDRVSLYLHYRENAGNYADYVGRSRQLFPNAVIWAGSYAYDRVDYLPCGEGHFRHCTEEQEKRLFRESLEIQIGLMQDGKVAAIEFYPGFFGRESEWHGWSKPRICAASRRSACVETTRIMRTVAADLLDRR